VSGKVKAATGVKLHAMNECEGVEVKCILNLISLDKWPELAPFPTG